MQEGETICLLTNLSKGITITQKECSFVIDLKGHSIVGEDALNNNDISKAAITIESANVTIRDSIGGSRLSGGTGYYYEADRPDEEGNCVIDRYEAEGASAIVAKVGANVTIESGIYIAGGKLDTQFNFYYDSSIPTIGCDTSSSVTLAGGGYKSVFKEKLFDENVSLKEGCYVVKDDEKYTGEPSELSDCSVRVVADTITYGQLQVLITEVKSNLSDGTYNDYTTASVNKLSKAISEAEALDYNASTEVIKSAYDKLIQASSVSENGLIKVTKRIEVIAVDANKQNTCTGVGAYSIGDTVTLKAYAKKGYKFLKWTTSPDSDENIKETREITFVVDENTPEQWYVWYTDIVYSVTIGESEGGTASLDKEGNLIIGESITATATPNDGYEFVGWVDKYGVTVSAEVEYMFLVSDNTTITPVFIKVKNDSNQDIIYVTVNFYHQSGNVLSTQKVVADEGIVTVPSAPTKIGYIFKGWSSTNGGTPIENLEESTFSNDTNLYPVFEQEQITYTLTVNGEDNGTYKPQETVSVSAPEVEGKKFAGWKNSDGIILSYNMDYSFIITKDTDIYTEYVKEGQTIEEKSSISIDAPIYTLSDDTILYELQYYK